MFLLVRLQNSLGKISQKRLSQKILLRIATCHIALHTTNRAWRRWGNSIPSAWNRSPILLQKLKLRTKSQIVFRLLELKQNRNTKDEDLFVSPNNAKPLLAAIFFSLIISILKNNLKIFLK
jgi:hypothetical protein